MPVPQMSAFPAGFMNGLSVRGMPLLQTQPGNVYWVSNDTVTGGDPVRTVGGSDGNKGTFLRPFSSIAYALSLCVQGNGDIIFVKPGHVEYVTGAGTKTQGTNDALATFTMNCAGVAIVGLGSGYRKPRIEFNTAATANLPVRSAFMSIQNFDFLANFADIASLFTSVSGSFATSTIVGTVLTLGAATGSAYPGQNVMGTGVQKGTIILNQVSGTANGAGVYTVNVSQTVSSTTITTGTWDFAIENCNVYDASSSLNALTVYTSAATNANNSDGFRFAGNFISSLGTTAATTALKAGVGNDRWTIIENVGNWAAINASPTMLAMSSFNLTNLTFAKNRSNRPCTAGSVGAMITGSGTACTGQVFDNQFWGLTATPIICTTGTKLAFQNNLGSNAGAADKSGLLLPASS